MKKSCVFILFLMLLPFSYLEAQQNDLKTNYNEKTYTQFLASDWTGIIDTGKEALEKGVDFYYLRLRMGIAYGAQFNYRMAIVNYKKALEFVPTDPVAQEYLYYAYLYAGMKYTATLYVNQLPLALRKKINPEHPLLIGNIYLETGFAAVDYTDNNLVLSTLENTYFSEFFKRESQTYFNFNLLLNLANSVSLNFAYTGLGVKSEHWYQITGLDEANEALDVKQNDLYLALNIHNARGLTLIPFFHNVNTAMQLTEVTFNIITSDPLDIAYDINSTNLNWNDQLLGFGFLKHSGLFDIAGSFSYSWLNLTEQQQFSGSVSFLPRGNYSLYFTPEIRLFNEDEEKRMIYKFTMGLSLTPKIWTETAFTYGNLKSTHEKFGAIVYNLPDKTNYKFDAVIHYALNHGVSLSLRYQLTQKESAITNTQLETIQTNNGFGMGEGSQTVTEYNLVETETFSFFNQHFIIVGFNWAI